MKIKKFKVFILFLIGLLLITGPKEAYAINFLSKQLESKQFEETLDNQKVSYIYLKLPGSSRVIETIISKNNKDTYFTDISPKSNSFSINIDPINKTYTDFVIEEKSKTGSSSNKVLNFESITKITISNFKEGYNNYTLLIKNQNNELLFKSSKNTIAKMYFKEPKKILINKTKRNSIQTKIDVHLKKDSLSNYWYILNNNKSIGLDKNYIYNINLLNEGFKGISGFKLYSYSNSNYKLLLNYKGLSIDSFSIDYIEKVLKFRMTSNPHGLQTFFSPDLNAIKNTDSLLIGDFTYSNPKLQNKPLIIGKTYIKTYLRNPISLEEIKKSLVAKDSLEGNITDKIKIESDEYSKNKSKIGNYKIIFIVKNKSNNETKHTVTVNILNDIKPTLIADKTIESISYTKTFDVDHFKKSFIIKDNYSNLKNTDIKLIKNDYTSNKNKPGKYSVEFYVSDEFKNDSTFIKEIKVIDDVSPLITGPNEIETTIDNPISINVIKKQLTSKDEIDNDITNKILTLLDNYTPNKSNIGTYKIEFYSSDSHNNRKTHQVLVKVLDTTKPLFFTKDHTSKTTSNNQNSQKLSTESKPIISNTSINKDSNNILNNSNNLYLILIGVTTISLITLILIIKYKKKTNK